MELVSIDISRAQADKKPIVICPLGDMQWAGKRGPTALDMLKRRIDKGLELGAWFLGMGDYIDFLSPSNRARLRAADLYDTAEDVIDEKALDLVYEIYDLALKPTKGRWLGMLEGHHFAQLKHGDTTDQRLCQMLDARFLGTTAFIRLNIAFGKVSQGSITILATHGAGSGQTPAAPVTKLTSWANYWDADIIVIGHMTKLATAPLNRIYASWSGGAGHLQHRKITLVGAGGFSKGYIEHSRQGQVPRGGYVEAKMLNPASLGSPVIRILPNVDQYIHDGNRTRLWAPEVTVEL